MTLRKSRHTIHLWGALRPHAGGAGSVILEAATIRELFRNLVEQHPGMEADVQRGIAVSINGKIYRDQWETVLPESAEIYLMPRLAGG